jgi:hypothetical protein
MIEDEIKMERGGGVMRARIYLFIFFSSSHSLALFSCSLLGLGVFRSAVRLASVATTGREIVLLDQFQFQWMMLMDDWTCQKNKKT